MAESDDASQLKRCPRCETTKHKSEITSRGWCRPCSRAYDREREIAKAEKEGRPPSKPRKPGAPPPAKPAIAPTTIRQIADKVAAPIPPIQSAPFEQHTVDAASSRSRSGRSASACG